MAYHIYLLRKEVKEQNTNFDFLENEDLITKFTNEQFEKLKQRLISYKFEIENEKSNSVTFNFQGGQLGISVLLTKSQLAFSSGFTENGIFEICMTASEFTDTGEFEVFNPQLGKWDLS